MNWLAVIGSYAFIVTLLFTWNHGAHRKSTPHPDPLVMVKDDGLSEIWVRQSEAWRWE